MGVVGIFSDPPLCLEPWDYARRSRPVTLSEGRLTGWRLAVLVWWQVGAVIMSGLSRLPSGDLQPASKARKAKTDQNRLPLGDLWSASRARTAKTD